MPKGRPTFPAGDPTTGASTNQKAEVTVTEQRTGWASRQPHTQITAFWGPKTEVRSSPPPISSLYITINRLVARVERRQAELVALRNDALAVRGSLAPADGDRKVPFELGETLTPAVDWLIARVAELEAERHTTNEALDDAVRALRNHDHVAEAYPGELVMLRGLVATLRVVAEHGDLADVVKLLDEHQRDEQDAFAETGGA